VDTATETQGFMQVYSFMKDRTRQLCQDMSIINCQPDKYTIGCLEQIARYLIVSQHDGISHKDYDMYTNFKQITGILGDLRDKQYARVGAGNKGELLNNQIEMFCYQIIATSHSIVEFQKLIRSLDHLSPTAQEQELLKEAVEIATSVQTQNHVKFFKLFRKTNYMFACLMLNFFEFMRRHALFHFIRAFRDKEMKGDFISAMLLLPDKTDLYNCLVGYGFTPDPDTCNFNLTQRAPYDDWSTAIKKFNQ
jgi:hypothetical protein